MDFEQKQYIFNRVSEEFNVSRVKKRYYCDKISTGTVECEVSGVSR